MSNILTPTPGGHVFAGTWERLAALDTATCEACGEYIKEGGALALPERQRKPGSESEDGLCEGWRDTAPRGQLARVVRGLVREAPNDKPNGPSETALEALHSAHLAMLSAHDCNRMIVNVDRVRTEGDCIYRLGEAMADDCRALQLALEHDERSALCKWCGFEIVAEDAAIKHCPARDGDLCERSTRRRG